MPFSSLKHYRQLWKFISQAIFHSLYLLVQFFILIGEATQFILLLPIKVTIVLYKKVTHSLIQLYRNIKTKIKGLKPFTFRLPQLPAITLKPKKKETVSQTHSPLPTSIYQYTEKIHEKNDNVTFVPIITIIITTFKQACSKLFTYRLHSLTSKVKRISSAGPLKVILTSFVVAITAKNTSMRIVKDAFKIIFFPFYLLKLSVTTSFKYFYIGFFVCLLIIFVHQSYAFVRTLPSPQNIGKVNYPLTTILYDRNGKLLYEIYRDQNRTPIELKNLPKHVYQAAIAIEDKDFYRHNGVSFFSGILRAAKEIVLTKKIQGGSTITQQLVKTALLSPERTLERKLKEMFLAMWAERLYTKDQILQMYLNQVPYGGSAYGIEEAAKIYFGKSANQLTISEAALLAGLPQAPSTYSPHVDPQLAMRRRNDVLREMKNQGYIDEKQFKIALADNPNVLPIANNLKAPHFVFYVKDQLEQQYGIQQVEEGGLRVTTTLDLDIQEEAEKILREEIDKARNLNVTNGAILVTRPSTGEILAMAGSVDYYASPSGAFNVTTAKRQPGSSIKPLVYAMALEKNFTAATLIDDSPVVFNIPGSEPYRPLNYDNRFHGKVSFRYALANSYNIPAVKLIQALGVDKFIYYARRLGITTWNDISRYGLSLSLGGGEVKMVDMAEAFGVFATMGNKVDLTGIARLQNTNKEVLDELQPRPYKVMDEGIAYIMSDVLSDNVARQWAFGPRSFLEIPGYKVAVKTGTTNDKKDNWTIGYTPEFVVVVWVGNNDNTPMHPYLSSGVTGAAPIWNRMMTYLLQNKSENNPEKAWFTQPESVVQKSCGYGKNEVFLRGTENTVSCFAPSSTAPTPQR
jgi:1A family penicillin-binding protein